MSKLTPQQITALKAHIQQLKPTLGGRVLYSLVRFRRAVVLENMQRVFGDALTADEIQRLALAFYSHVATSIRENLASRFQSFATMQANTIVEGEEHVFKAAEQGKGLLILTGHFGNWEYAPLAGLMQFPEYHGRFHFIRKTLSWQWLERWLFSRFFAAGLRVIPKKNAMPKVMAALGRQDAVVFVLDQAASMKRKQGVPTHFFGDPVGTYRSLATIARSSQAPVLAGTSYRRADGKHVLRFQPPLSWIEVDDSKQEIITNTENYNRVLEQLVLEHPEQWLWMHRRWKIH